MTSAIFRTHRHPISLYPVVGIGLLATALSAAGSWIPSFWGDEAASVLSAERPLGSLFRMLGQVDAVHGTYYLFLHFWVQLFDASPFSVRFPSSLAVGSLVAGVVLLGARLDTARTGVLAGIVALALPRITDIGQEARGYAMSAAVVVWLTYLLVKILADQSPKRRFWMLYAVGLAACGYLFLFSLLIVVAHAAMVLTSRRRETVRSWSAAAIIGVLLTGPVIGFGIAQLGQVAFLAGQGNATVKTFAVTQWFGNGLFAVVAWSLILAAVTVWAVWVRRSTTNTAALAPEPDVHLPTLGLVPLAAIWLLAAPTILIAVSLVHPVYSSRYTSFALPGAALLIGWILARISPRALSITALAAVLAAASPSYLTQRTPNYKNHSDWSQIAETIRAHSTAGEGILFDDSTRPSRSPRLAMRTYPAAFKDLVDVALDQPWYVTNNWHDSVKPATSLASRIAPLSSIWLVQYRSPGSKPASNDRKMLQSLGLVVVDEYSLPSSVMLRLSR